MNNVNIYYNYIKDKSKFDSATYSEQVELICAGCKKTFFRKKVRTLASFRNRNSPELYCSSNCASRNNKKVEHSKLIICFQCKTKFYRVPSQNKNSICKFCSKKCSSIYHNNLRKKPRYCSVCNKQTKQNRKYCSDNCFKQRILKKGIILGNKTISEVMNRSGSNSYDIIRSNAKNILKRETQICKNCKYNKHVEVCHIKPISSFPKTTLIKEVNNQQNLVLLCPNCHWEFDHGLLKLVALDGVDPS